MASLSARRFAPPPRRPSSQTGATMRLSIRGFRAVLPLESDMETARTHTHTFTSKRTRKTRKCYHTRVEREKERERERVILGMCNVYARVIRAKTRTYKQTHTCTQKQNPTYKPTRAHTHTHERAGCRSTRAPRGCGCGVSRCAPLLPTARQV